MTTVYRSWERIMRACQRLAITEEDLLEILACKSCVADMKSAHTDHKQESIEEAVAAGYEPPYS
mgnify:FL=1